MSGARGASAQERQAQDGVSPALEPEVAQWYAEKYYDVEDEVLRVFEPLETPILDRHIANGMRVLDAMMGRGRHALRYAGRGCAVWGNDLNPHMVALVGKAAEAAALSLTLTALDARDLRGIEDGAFDVSFAMYSSLGTIPGSAHRQRAMDEIARVTRQGGLVVIQAHNRLDTFFERDLLAAALRGQFLPREGMERGDILLDYHGLKDMRNHLYTPGELKESFERAGMRVVEEHYMDYANVRMIDGTFRKLQADGFVFVGKKA